MSRQSAALVTRRRSLQGSPASVQSRIGSVILSLATLLRKFVAPRRVHSSSGCGPIGQRSGALGQNDWKPAGRLHGRGDFIDDLVCCSQGAHPLLPAGLDARRPQSSPRSEIVALLKARDDLAKCGIARRCAGLSIIADVGRPVEFASRRRVRDRVERNGFKTVAVRTLSDRAHDHLFQLVAGSYRLVHGFRPSKRPLDVGRFAAGPMAAKVTATRRLTRSSLQTRPSRGTHWRLRAAPLHRVRLRAVVMPPPATGPTGRRSYVRS